MLVALFGRGVMFTGIVIERFFITGLACELIQRSLVALESVASDAGPSEAALVETFSSRANFLLLTNPVFALPKPKKYQNIHNTCINHF